MIKVILIDDEPLARSILREYLQRYSTMQVVEECGDGFEGVKAVALHQPDLIFLDVQMPKINGFEMLELLDKPQQVIFTTAYDEYAIKAFDANAVDYLLKPFSQERFDKAISTWQAQAGKEEGKRDIQTLIDSAELGPGQMNRVVVKTGVRIRIIPVQEIHYLEADDDYVKIHTKEGSFLKKKTMNYFEEGLDGKQFVRVHRSYLLQVGEITRIEPYEKEGHIAILRSGMRVPISKTGYAKIKQILGL